MKKVSHVNESTGNSDVYLCNDTIPLLRLLDVYHSNEYILTFLLITYKSRILTTVGHLWVISQTANTLIWYLQPCSCWFWYLASRMLELWICTLSNPHHPRPRKRTKLILYFFEVFSVHGLISGYLHVCNEYKNIINGLVQQGANLIVICEFSVVGNASFQ